MLQVIAINSSKRKINTFGLICQAKEIMIKYAINVEIINLYEYDIKDCLGCEFCILKDTCMQKDDVQQIMEKIIKSDGVILTSPVYLQAVSGKLKTFVDRTCKWYHRPEIYGKPVLVMATTKGSGLSSTLKYLEKVVTQWGGIKTGRIGRNIRNIEKNITEKECECFIHHLKMDRKEYKPSLDSLLNFQVQKVLASHLSDLDEAYWEAKGWKNKGYYFNCKINLFKRIVATCLYKIISQVMKKK